jgi:hypothetical protein
MDKFSLNEVSFVTVPAQTPALADIQKADLDILLDENTVVNTEKAGDLVSLFTSIEDGHQHGVSVEEDCEGLRIFVHWASSEDDTTGSHDHQITRTIDGQYVLSENHGHSHTIDQASIVNILMAIMAKYEKTSDLGTPKLKEGGLELASLPEIVKASKSDSSKEVPMDEELKKALEKVETLQAELAKSTAINSMTDVHKQYFDSLDESIEDDLRKSFIEASTEQRDVVVKEAQAKIEKAKEVVYTAVDGTEYTKADDPRLVKMAKDRDEDRKEHILLQKAAEDAEITKQAETELANLPGDLEVRKALVKSVNSIEDADTRQKALDALKAHNAKLHTAFETVGAAGTVNIEKAIADKQAAADKLDELAKARAAEKGENFYDAYAKVSEDNPELRTKAVNG